MPKSKGKNTDEGEGNVAEGLVDLGIDNEKDNEAEKNLKQIQAKKATKFQQKKEKKMQIKFNTLKRQRNKVLCSIVCNQFTHWEM